MKLKDVLIIGTGISGVVVARKLAEKGFKVSMYEKRNHIGGNLYDYELNGVLVHKYGPHIFHTSKQNVIDFVERFWKLNGFKNVVEGFVDNKLVPIPFNFKSIDICFPNKSEEIKNRLLSRYKQESITILELQKDEDPMIKRLADFVYENVFLNYTTKMWNLKPDEIDPSVTARIPIILSYRNTYFNDIYEGLPVDGYTNSIKRMLDHENIEYQINVDANQYLTFKENKVLFKDEEKIIIYTGPLDKLFSNKYGPLEYRSLVFEFEDINKKQFQKTAVVNYPSDPKMTRITEYKNMTLQEAKNTIISKEFPGTYNENCEKWNEPYYPLATNLARDKYNKYKNEALKYKNLFLLGRMATYKYINMDQAIEDALILSQKIIDLDL